MLGVVAVGVVPPSAVARIVAAHLHHASLWPCISAAAQHAAVADRFAHEIVGFWEASPALAAAERQPVGRIPSSVALLASLRAVDIIILDVSHLRPRPRGLPFVVNQPHWGVR